MCKVTVLVAVYNAEAYLTECLDSLLGQTLGDLQIVCIDDASTDGSLALLRRYAAADGRVEVIALSQNGGQAHARNVGLLQARGEYVCMVDADDWLSADALQQAVSAFDDGVDSVLFEVVYWRDGRETPYTMPPFGQLTGDEAFRLSLTWQVHGLYLIRTFLHRQHPYDETCLLYSDDNTTRIHYLLSRRVGRCQGVYYYRQHSQSSTNRVSVRRFDVLKANESMRRQMLDMGIGLTLMDEYERQRWLNLVDVYMFYHVHGRQLPAAERHYGLSELKRVWASVDRGPLRGSLIQKFGYRPCAAWPLFRLQEWLYFTLRGFLGKNR